MANVQLPNIGISNSDIDNASLPQLQQIVKSLLNSTIQLTEELTYLLNNLDTRNVNELNAEVIIAKTITADKMSVNELSAISANIGKVTSGEIYGNYIATREDAYPRAEMNNAEDLFGAYFDEGNFIYITSDQNGSPALVFVGGGNLGGYINLFGGLNFSSTLSAAINALQGSIELNAGGNIRLEADGSVVVPSWGQLFSRRDGQTLQDVLDDIYSQLGGGSGGTTTP